MLYMTKTKTGHIVIPFLAYAFCSSGKFRWHDRICDVSGLALRVNDSVSCFPSQERIACERSAMPGWRTIDSLPGNL